MTFYNAPYINGYDSNNSWIIKMVGDEIKEEFNVFNEIFDSNQSVKIGEIDQFCVNVVNKSCI